MLFAQEQSFKACVLILCLYSVLNSTVDRSECCVSGVLNWSFNYCVLLKQKLQVNDTDVNIQLVVSRSFYCVLLVCVHVTPYTSQPEYNHFVFVSDQATRDLEWPFSNVWRWPKKVTESSLRICSVSNTSQ